jgi:hypothetical protein
MALLSVLACVAAQPHGTIVIALPDFGKKQVLRIDPG